MAVENNMFCTITRKKNEKLKWKLIEIKPFNIYDLNVGVTGKHFVGDGGQKCVVSETQSLGCWPLLPKVRKGRTLNVRVVGCKTLQRST